MDFRQIDIKLGKELVKLIAEIDFFKGRWKELKNLAPSKLEKLKKIAAIESIGSSTRIEGSSLSDTEVEKILSGLKTQSFLTRDEQEVAGYAESMDLVFLNFKEINLSENNIFQLHQSLLRHSTKDERHRGQYKTLDNHVVAFSPDGKELGVIFETSTPFDTPKEMELLVSEFNKAANEESMHPLLLIAIFIVKFLAIHPFQDGNGRLSRILTTLLLLRAGYEYVPFSSLESIVEKNKEFYYKSLRRTQVSLKKEKVDWEPWVRFFLSSLGKQKDFLLEMVEGKESETEKLTKVTSELHPLSEKIVKLIEKHQKLNLSEITELTGSNKNTIKLRLRKLVEAGFIVKHGKARATWYERSV